MLWLKLINVYKRGSCLLWLVMGSVLLANLTQISWWRHQMEIFSALLAICAGNPKASDAELWCFLWTVSGLSCPLWRHCNVISSSEAALNFEMCEMTPLTHWGRVTHICVHRSEALIPVSSRHRCRCLYSLCTTCIYNIVWLMNWVESEILYYIIQNIFILREFSC